MNIRQTLALALLLAGLVQSARGADGPDLPDALKQPWGTVKLAIYLHGGDYDAMGPCVYIQRLPDQRLLLSCAAMTVGAERLPVARCFVSDADVTALLAETALYWEKAKSEISERERVAKLPPAEQAAIRAKAGFGLSETVMRIEVSSPDRARDLIFHNSVAESAEGWMRLLTKAGVAAP